MKKVAIIARKSPGKKKEKSISKQKDICKKSAIKELGNDVEFMTYADVGVSGDEELGRKRLYSFFKKMNNYDYAYCLDVDRFSRSYLGLYWLHQYFLESTCQLRFVSGPNLYNKDGSINHEGYLHFFILCGFASYELMRIRDRTKIGRDRAEKEGIKFGRPKKDIDWKKVKELRNKGLSWTKTARVVGVSTPTLIDRAEKEGIK